MKALLEAIEQALIASGEFGDRVFYTEAIDFVPPQLRTPAAGIHAGEVESQDLADNGLRQAMKVNVFVYAQALKPGEALMGNAATNLKGVLDLTDAVAGLLRGNLLGLAAQGLNQAKLEAEGETIAWSDKGRVMTARSLTLIYERET